MVPYIFTRLLGGFTLHKGMTLDTLIHIPSLLPNHYTGKVRDTFDLNDGRMVFVTSDRLSAFDRSITSVPDKGAILNGIARFWFEHTNDILPNHVLSYPDPNVMVVKKLAMLPVEVVVRRYMTGTTGTSIWTKYKNGERGMYGHVFPEGLRKNQELGETILTPTTKGKSDDPISGDEIVDSGLVERSLWLKTEAAALALFKRGQEIAAKQGLILVDTKYEFGVDEDGVLRIADEIHTPDSSRYWVAASYAQRHARGDDPEGLDKEFVRQWLVERMADPYTGDIPPIMDADRLEFAAKYARLYKMVTGREFDAPAGGLSTLERIEKTLRKIAPASDNRPD